MADGAWEITNAGKKVHGEEGTRLMCWSHAYRNVDLKLTSLRKLDKVLADRILDDIKNIQRKVTSESEFKVVFMLLENKFMEEAYTPDVEVTMKAFFKYFRGQWGPNSHVFSWWEGAHPYHCSNNQGIEGTNKQIKRNHTYRRRLPLGEFFTTVDRMVMEYSEMDDSLLHGPRVNFVYHSRDGFKIQEEGYQYFVKNL